MLNNLSWLIYVMGLVEKMEDGLITAMIVIAAGTMVYFMARGETASWEQIRSQVMKSGIALAVCLFVITIIPSKRTVTLIAASEVGERVLKTDLAQNALTEIDGIGKDSVNLLKKYIEREMLDLNQEIEKKKDKRT